MDDKESMTQMLRRALSPHPVDSKSTAVSLLENYGVFKCNLKFNSVLNICEIVQLLYFKTFNQRSDNH